MKTSTIASLIGILFVTPTFAEEELKLNDIEVTSSRFDEQNTISKSNLRVITQQEIAKSPAISIPDILRMQAGINVRSLYGNQGIDATVDMRGFGEAATGNVLILLDGQRLNPVDGGNIQWASIPLQSIERIEVLTGGGTVLYGDRATGGVINLITNKSGKKTASLTTTLGSYGYRGADGYMSGSNGDFYFNTFVHTADANGWRQNADSDLWSVSGRLGLCASNSDGFVDYAVYRAENGLPSSISSQVYRDNPRAARTLFDSQIKEGFRLRPGVSMKISDSVEFATELAISNMHSSFDNVSLSSTSERDVDNYALTPRLKWAHDFLGVKSSSVFGYDYYRGRIQADYHGTYANGTAKQSSHAIYWQNDTAINNNLNLNTGVRFQKTYQRANQDAYAPFGMSAIAGDETNHNSAYDFGLNYHQEAWSIYAKTASSFRLASTDELFGTDPITFQPLFYGNIIKPQTAHTQEIGATLKQHLWNSRVVIFRSNVHNEIGYDGNLGVNTNFDPTRHQGVEAELGWQMVPNLQSKLSYTYTEASFTKGVYRNQNIPLVPTNIARAQLDWNSQGYGRYVVQANYVGQSYTSGDYANSLEKLSSYTTLDLRANWDLKPVQLNLVVQNLTDKKYAPYGIYSTYRNDYFYFPGDGRSAYLSLRYDFK